MIATTTTRRTYQMLGNETLWQTAARVDAALADAGVPYAIAGGVAVALHGYRRNTVDLDVIVRQENFDAFRAALENSESDVPVKPLIAGELAGPGQLALLPDPSDEQRLARIEGLPALSLAELIQSKIACGLGNLRRTHKDFADVVELAAVHHLDGSFARFLHKSVRAEFRTLAKRAQG